MARVVLAHKLNHDAGQRRSSARFHWLPNTSRCIRPSHFCRNGELMEVVLLCV